jgi:putative oxidoreductase
MILRRVARPLLGSIFIFGGVNELRQLDAHAQAAEPVVKPMPTEPEQAVKLDAAVKVIAGSALAMGVLPRLAALLLAGSLVPTTIAGHRFWEQEDPQERSQQQIHFMKNLGLLGGLLLASADTKGKPSLGWRAKRVANKVGDRLP